MANGRDERFNPNRRMIKRTTNTPGDMASPFGISRPEFNFRKSFIEPDYRFGALRNGARFVPLIQPTYPEGDDQIFALHDQPALTKIGARMKARRHLWDIDNEIAREDADEQR